MLAQPKKSICLKRLHRPAKNFEILLFFPTGFQEKDENFKSPGRLSILNVVLKSNKFTSPIIIWGENLEWLTLKHEFLDNSMKNRSFVMKRFSCRSSFSFFASTQCPKIFSGLWNQIVEKFKNYPSKGTFTLDLDVKINHWS